jgi:hypothetical protein
LSYPRLASGAFGSSVASPSSVQSPEAKKASVSQTG